MKLSDIHRFSAIKNSFFAALLTCILNSASAQLSGTYTIGGSGTPDYATLGAAITDVTTNGVNGPVIFEIAAGTYTEQLVIPAISGASGTNSVVFQSADADNSLVSVEFATNSTSNYVVKLNGADYIQFKNLSFTSKGTTYGRVFEITGGADYNRFENCIFTGTILSDYNNTRAVFYSNDGTDSFNTFEGNTFLNGSHGIYMRGTSSVYESDNSFINNLFQNQYNCGAYFNYQSNLSFSNNTIQNNSVFDNAYGLYMSYMTVNNTITGNKIYVNGAKNGAALSFYQIFSTVAQPTFVANNFMQCNGEKGISCTESRNINYYYNTVKVTGFKSASSAFYLSDNSTTGTVNIVLTNNILINEAIGYVYQIYCNPTAYSFTTNNVYSNGLIFARTNHNTITNYYSTFEEWTTTGKDAGSCSVLPYFYSDNDLHCFHSALNGTATPIATSTTDIDGETRNETTPDIGADEFDGDLLDAALQWNFPVGAMCSEGNTITVELKNTNGTTIESAELSYSDGTTTVSQAFSDLNVASDSSVFLSFSTLYNTPSSGNLFAYINSINTVTDAFQTNDTTEIQNLTIGMSGAYTINQALATGGTNFASITEAVTALTTNGICGAVEFSLASGTYNERILLPQIKGSSAANTLLFQSATGNPADVIIQKDWKTLMLEGVDYVSFKNLTLKSTGTTSSYVVTIDKSSTHITFEGNILTGYNGTSSAATCSLVFSETLSTAPSTNDSNITFRSNRFVYGSHAILFDGDNSSFVEEGIVIENNSFENQFSCSISLSDQLVTIKSNTFTGIGMYGIYLSGSRSQGIIEGNTIKLHSRTLTKGIQLVGVNGNTTDNFGSVSNNVIVTTLMGISNTSSYGFNILHNSVNIIGTDTTSAAFHWKSNSSDDIQLNVQNNIFVNNAGGYVYNLDVACRYNGLCMFNSNFNNLYTTGRTFVKHYCYISSSSTMFTRYLKSFAAWQANLSTDGNSVSVTPFFASSTDLHVYNSFFDGSATPTSIVTDIDGEPRNETTPDMGAYEFTPTVTDAKIDWVSPTAPTVEGDKEVIVNITNFGGTTISDLSLSYTDQTASHTETFTGLSILPATSQQISFVEPYNVTLSVDMQAYINTVNTEQDYNQTNDTTAVQDLFLPLGGVYTVNPAEPTFDHNFQTITDATYALMNYGIRAAVEINIFPGTYNEAIILGVIPGISETNNVVIQSADLDSSTVIIRPNLVPTIELTGTKYITIRHLTISVVNEYASGNALVSLKVNAKNVTLSNNQLIGKWSNTAGSKYVVFSNAVHDSINNANLTISNNLIVSGSHGICVYGRSANYNTGLKVINNQFVDGIEYGIALNYSDAPEVSGNTIALKYERPYTATINKGIFLNYCKNSMKITKNRVVLPYDGGTALELLYCVGTADQRGAIENNYLYTFSGNGIKMNNSPYQNIFYNTHFNEGTYNNSYSLSASSSNFTTAKNNNFCNYANGKSVIISSSTNFSSNYNNLYANGSTFATYNSTNCMDFNAWKTNSGQDANSISYLVEFFNKQQPYHKNVFLNNAGTPLAVLADIDDNPRHATNPDIGASEYTPPANDAGIIALDAPFPHFESGTRDIKVTMVNYGAVALTSLEFHYAINNIEQTVYNWEGSLNPGDTLTNIIIGNYLFNNGIHQLSIWIANPNLATDEYLENDSLSITLVSSSMQGTYHIGATREYISFSQAADSVNRLGIVGPVTFLVDEGEYNEQVIFKNILGVSAINTITFKPLNAGIDTVVLKYQPLIADSNYTLQLNGADYLIFDSLSFYSTGNVVEICNGADYNTFRNCRFAGSGRLVTSPKSGDQSEGTSDGNTDYYNSFINNVFEGGTYAFHYAGGYRDSFYYSYMDSEFGLLIEGNFFNNQTYESIHLLNQNSFSIINNQFVSKNKSGYERAIYIESSDDYTITGNRMDVEFARSAEAIHLFRSPDSQDIWSDQGGQVYNNFIHFDLKTTSNASALCLKSSSLVSAFYNNFSVNGSSVNSTIVYISAEIGTVTATIKNNSMANFAGGKVIELAHSSGDFSKTYNGNYNNLYTSGSYIAKFYGTNYATLANLQAARSVELNSVSVDPMYNSPSDMHVNQSALNNIGTPIATVTVDIDGEARSASTPDIGADEFTPSEFYLLLSSSTIQIDALETCTATMNITSNTDWTVAEDEDWLTLSISEGTGNATITFTAQINPVPVARTAIVRVSRSGVADQLVTVTQDPKLLYLNLSTTSLTFAGTANSTKTFSITSNVNWNITSSQTWLSADVSSGQDDATITLTAEQNPEMIGRLATLTVSADGVTTKTISITQQAGPAILEVSITEVTLPAAATDTTTFQITSNTSWTVSRTQSWLTRNPVSGTGNATITIITEENPNYTSRTGYLVASTSGSLSKDVMVIQSAREHSLTVSADTVEIGFQANSTASFDITSDVSWTVSDDQAWLATAPSSGSNNATIQLTAQGNPTTEIREALVTVTGTGVAVKTVVVRQHPAVEYEISASVDPINAGSITGAGNYIHGQLVTLVASPESGYEFKNWAEQGEIVSTTATLEFTAIESRILVAHFSEIIPVEYSLTINLIGNGSVNVNGTAYTEVLTFDENTVVNLEALAAEGYEFAGWTGDLVSTNANESVTMTANKTITATFTEIVVPQYTLTINVMGDGLVNVNGTAYTEVLTFDENTVVNLEALATKGYEFAGWTGDLVSTNANESVTMTANKTITATFTEIVVPQYTLTINVVGEGSVNVNGTAYTEVLTFDENTVVNLEALAAEGYEFAGWTGDLVSTNANESVTMTANKTITATFTEIVVPQYTLTINVVGDGLVNVNGTAYTEVLTFDENTVVNLEALAAEGYEFAGWTGDLVSTNVNESVTMTENKTITATFTEIEVPQYTLTITVVGQGTTTPTAGDHVYAEGTQVNLFASPALGYEFQKWIVGSDEFTTQSLQITVNENVTATAYFVESATPQFTLTMVKVGNGTVNPPAGDHVYNQNSVVTVTAAPAEGWEFEGWTGDLVSTNATESVTMTANKAITATFTEIVIPQYTLTINFVGQGSVNVNGTAYTEVLTFDEGTELNLVALAAEGYEFTGWTGDLVSANATESVTMTANKTITATFTEIVVPQYTLTINVVGQGSVNVNGTVYSQVLTFDENTVVNLEALAASGWEFDSWTGSVANATETTTTVTMTGNTTVTATFTEIEIPQYTLTINVVGQGSVNVNGTVYSQVLTFDENTVVNLEALTTEGYEFAGWTGDLVSTNATESVTMTANKAITATFTEIVIPQYTLTISVVGQGSVNVNGTAYTEVLTFDEGTELSLVALAAEGYEFTGWTGDLVSASATESVTMTANKAITATFSEIVIPQYTLTISVVGQGSVNINGTAYTEVLTFDEGTELSLVALAAENYEFAGWTGDLVSVHATESVIMSANKAITATFTEIVVPQYTLTISLVGQGSVNVNGTAYTEVLTFDEGTELSLVALAAENYEFAGWTGDLVSTNATESVTMTANKAITAMFTEIVIPQYTLTISVVGQGSVSVNGTAYTEVLTFDEGTELSLVALAAEGYEFAGWTGDLVSSNATESVTMTANKAITATFTEIVPEEYTITFIVTNENQQPISGAAITFEEINALLITNANGLATIELPNGTYHYTVAAQNYISENESFTVNGNDLEINIQLSFVGISDVTPTTVKLYPNPVVDVVTLERTTTERVKVEVYSNTSALLQTLEWETAALQLNVAGYKNGLFHIRVVGQNIENLRFVKQ